MGKAGRIACITTPMVLTIASLIALAFVEVSGWSKGSPLNNNYMMSINFSNFSTAGADSGDLTTALSAASTAGILEDQYRVYLWSYCTGDKADSNMDWCSKKQSGFVFDPVDLFKLNSTDGATPTSTSSSDNAVQSAINNVKDKYENSKDELLGETASKAMSVYKRVAKWNFWAYQIAFWTTVTTIVVGLLAICSRWGSLCTWIMAAISTIFTFLASLTTTIMFSTLAGALKGLFNPYHIKVDIGTRALAITWIATALSIGATLFWLFSICCCSGRSNPHHRSNKGDKGLWNTEPKDSGRRSVMSLGKTGTGYSRVESPHHGDRVPLHNYPAQPTAYQSPQPYGGDYAQQSNGFEPYRQQQQSRW